MAVKEAIHNTIKHAHASEVTITITHANDQLEIIVQDNGRGFAPGAPTEGNGLGNMRQRLAGVGGDCTVESRPGDGTTVRIHLVVRPIDRMA
jgi:signal transduction histidine kinase